MLDGFEKFIDHPLSSYSEIRTRRNEYDSWYGASELAAARRLKSGRFSVDFEPKFRLKPDSKVFTIGSCFARNVEQALIRRNVSVPTAVDCKISDDLLAKVPKQDALGNGYLNKYNTHSMLSHLSLALGDGELDEVVAIGDDKYWSLLLHNIKLLDRDTAFETARFVRSIIKRITTCDTVVITLGLNEVWYDSEKKVFLNGGPVGPALKRQPERFSMFRAGYNSTRLVLQEIHELLRKTIDPEIKIIVTVSPVPMGKTFSGEDIVVANSASKSILRAAAWDFARSSRNIEYFPSYEIAMFSDPTIVWESDRAHVRPEFVMHIIDNFVDLFFNGRSPSLAAAG